MKINKRFLLEDYSLPSKDSSSIKTIPSSQSSSMTNDNRLKKLSEPEKAALYRDFMSNGGISPGKYYNNKLDASILKNERQNPHTPVENIYKSLLSKYDNILSDEIKDSGYNFLMLATQTNNPKSISAMLKLGVTPFIKIKGLSAYDIAKVLICLR